MVASTTAPPSREDIRSRIAVANGRLTQSRARGLPDDPAVATAKAEASVELAVVNALRRYAAGVTLTDAGRERLHALIEAAW